VVLYVGNPHTGLLSLHDYNYGTNGTSKYEVGFWLRPGGRLQLTTTRQQQKPGFKIWLWHTMQRYWSQRT